MEKFGECKHVTQISKWTEGSSAGWEMNVFQPGFYYLDLYYKGKGKLVWNTSTEKVLLCKISRLQPGNIRSILSL